MRIFANAILINHRRYSLQICSLLPLPLAVCGEGQPKHCDSQQIIFRYSAQYFFPLPFPRSFARDAKRRTPINLPYLFSHRKKAIKAREREKEKNCSLILGDFGSRFQWFFLRSTQLQLEIIKVLLIADEEWYIALFALVFHIEMAPNSEQQQQQQKSRSTVERSWSEWTRRWNDEVKQRFLASSRLRSFADSSSCFRKRVWMYVRRSEWLRSDDYLFLSAMWESITFICC